MTLQVPKIVYGRGNDNDNDKVFYSTVTIHFIFNTAIDAFVYVLK